MRMTMTLDDRLLERLKKRAAESGTRCQRADRTCGNQEQRALCRARIDFPLLERWKSILWVA